MAKLTYHPLVNRPDKPLIWLGAEIRTPPFSAAARTVAGRLLRRLQRGERIAMPHARPIASIGARCLELRIADGPVDWRVVCRADPDAIVVADVFRKATQKLPRKVVATAKGRLARYDRLRTREG
jgi:phage-related protein